MFCSCLTIYEVGHILVDVPFLISQALMMTKALHFLSESDLFFLFFSHFDWIKGYTPKYYLRWLVVFRNLFLNSLLLQIELNMAHFLLGMFPCLYNPEMFPEISCRVLDQKVHQGPYQQFYSGDNHRLMLILLALCNLFREAVASDDQIYAATISIEFCWLRENLLGSVSTLCAGTVFSDCVPIYMPSLAF